VSKQEKRRSSTRVGSSGLLCCAVAGQRILAGCQDSFIYECDTNTLSSSTRVSAHEGAVTGLRVYESQAISVGSDGCLHLWDCGQGGLSRLPTAKYSSSDVAITILDSDPQLKLALTYNAERQICLWDLRTKQDSAATFSLNAPIGAMSFCSNWQQICCGDSTHMKWYDLRSPSAEEIVSSCSIPGGVQCITTDDHTMLAGTASGHLHVLSCDLSQPAQQIVVEYGKNCAVSKVQVVRGTGTPNCAITSTALGTLQLWESH